MHRPVDQSTPLDGLGQRVLAEKECLSPKLELRCLSPKLRAVGWEAEGDRCALALLAFDQIVNMLQVGKFVATASADRLTAGGSFSDGQNSLPIVNSATLTLRVIPEPNGPLLLTLGLLGLSSGRAGRGTERARAGCGRKRGNG